MLSVGSNSLTFAAKLKKYLMSSKLYLQCKFLLSAVVKGTHCL